MRNKILLLYETYVLVIKDINKIEKIYNDVW